jgi:hypothetical protein
MFEAIKNGNTTFIKNDDVRNCEAIVFAEAARSGKTMLEVVQFTLEDPDGDDDMQLFVACETLDEQVRKAYTKQIIEEYLDNLVYENRK